MTYEPWPYHPQSTKAGRTPRPWKVVEDIFNQRPEIRDEEGRRIAVVVCDYPKSMSSVTADAHILAAAPEMLEALVNLLNDLDEHATGSFGESEDAARAAIAKARGEQ
jgi:hypothetical protein